nr:histidine kinase dimerization/phosphoacceptor domain -containing protein [Aliiroseovarius sp. S1339]
MRAEFSTLADQLLHEEAVAQNSLHNANILQREIFHRVGNNLQIIQSILRLYAREAHSPDEKQLLARLVVRVRLINLVHKAMHQSADGPLLPVGSAVGKLIQGLRHEGMIGDNIEIVENFEPVQLRINRVYALCYLIAEKLDRLSRSGAMHLKIDILKDGDQAHLKIKGDATQLASVDPVSAQLRQVYQHELRATSHWQKQDDSVQFDAFMPRKVK